MKNSIALILILVLAACQPSPPVNVPVLKAELAAKVKIATTPPLVKLPPPYKTKV